MKEDPKNDVELKEMIFNNLAWLHLENARRHNPDITFEKLHEEIACAYLDHHVRHLCQKMEFSLTTPFFRLLTGPTTHSRREHTANLGLASSRIFTQH